MQDGSQLVQSNQKRLEEVRCIRDAIATRRSALADQEKSEITQRGASFCEDGEAMIEEILDCVEEAACQPVDVLRMIEGYISELGKRDVFRELSLDLEKEMASEGTAQLSAMEVKEEKLQAASRGGNMAKSPGGTRR